MEIFTEFPNQLFLLDLRVFKENIVFYTHFEHSPKVSAKSGKIQFSVWHSQLSGIERTLARALPEPFFIVAGSPFPDFLPDKRINGDAEHKRCENQIFTKTLYNIINQTVLNKARL